MQRTISLFARVGQGTLAPWDPTQRLVVLGPYRHVRNPMISGVLAILLGEAALLGSPPLLVWFGAFFAVNAALDAARRGAWPHPAVRRRLPALQTRGPTLDPHAQRRGTVDD